MDQVGLLSSIEKDNMQQNLIKFKSETGVQIQVFIPVTLNGEAIESVSIKIFDQWKLGSDKKDNGILFIIAPNDRKMRIEVGQGLEGSVPDAYAKRIIAEVVRPYFKQNQFGQGIWSGIAALQNYIINGDDGSLAAEKVIGRKIPSVYMLIFFGLLFFVFMPFLNRMNGSNFRGRSGGWGGGGFGGGYGGGGSSSGWGGGAGWSGGGGSSSGGGASGDW